MYPTTVRGAPGKEGEVVTHSQRHANCSYMTSGQEVALSWHNLQNWQHKLAAACKSHLTWVCLKGEAHRRGQALLTPCTSANAVLRN